MKEVGGGLLINDNWLDEEKIKNKLASKEEYDKLLDDHSAW